MLEEAKAKMLEVMMKNENKFANVEDPDSVADKVGMAAVIIQDFTSRRIKVPPFFTHEIPPTHIL